MMESGSKKLSINEVAKLFLWLAVFIIIYVFLLSREPIVMRIVHGLDIYSAILLLIVWNFTKNIFYGAILGIVAIPVIYYLITYVLLYELKLEKIFIKRNIVLLETKPKLAVEKPFRYAYILFAPIIIILRIILSTAGAEDALKYYLVIGDAMQIYIPYIAVLFVPFYILLDLSSARHHDKSRQLIKYPSALFNFILLIIINAGSVAALVPIYYDLLAITHNPPIALNLFILAIFFYYIPMLGIIIGSLAIYRWILKGYFWRIIKHFDELLVSKDVGIKVSLNYTKE